MKQIRLGYIKIPYTIEVHGDEKRLKIGKFSIRFIDEIKNGKKCVQRGFI